MTDIFFGKRPVRPGKNVGFSPAPGAPSRFGFLDIGRRGGYGGRAWGYPTLRISCADSGIWRSL